MDQMIHLDPMSHFMNHANDWPAPPHGFSFRSLLGDDDAWFNNNGEVQYNKANKQHTDQLKRPRINETAHNDGGVNGPKTRKIERCSDPELKKLRCGIGGSYRFSMSKLHFSKVVCPFCQVPPEEVKKNSKVSRLHTIRS